MPGLTLPQRTKAYLGAKNTLLAYYQSADKIPAWSEIGTEIHTLLRSNMIAWLREKECGDVAAYLEIPNKQKDEALDIIQTKIKSLRESSRKKRSTAIGDTTPSDARGNDALGTGTPGKVKEC